MPRVCIAATRRLCRLLLLLDAQTSSPPQEAAYLCMWDESRPRRDMPTGSAKPGRAATKGRWYGWCSRCHVAWMPHAWRPLCSRPVWLANIHSFAVGPACSSHPDRCILPNAGSQGKVRAAQTKIQSAQTLPSPAQPLTHRHKCSSRARRQRAAAPPWPSQSLHQSPS